LLSAERQTVFSSKARKIVQQLCCQTILFLRSKKIVKRGAPNYFSRKARKIEAPSRPYNTVPPPQP